MSYSPTTSPDPNDQGLEPWEIALAERIVHGFLAEHGSFRTLDAEDLIQECLLHWWHQRSQYSPSRGASMKTYMWNVLERKLIDIERRERADKRGGYSEDISLYEELYPEDEEGTTLLDVLPDNHTQANPEQMAEKPELKAHIDRVLRLLTPRQRQLAEKLGDGWSMSEISQRLKVPRAILYDELQRIRQVFRDEGLEEFLR